jgi:hypothetical protein
MMQTFILFIVAIVGLLLPVLAQQKTADHQPTDQACIAEWRAKKAGNQIKGMTQNAYVQQCRTGAATAQAPSSTSAANTTNGVAGPHRNASRTSTHADARRVHGRHGRRHARLGSE